MILIKTFESCACGRRTLGRLCGLRGFTEKEKISEGSVRSALDAANGLKTKLSANGARAALFHRAGLEVLG